MCKKLIYLVSVFMVVGLIGPVAAQEVDMEIGYAIQPPVLDGEYDDIWADASTQSFVPLADPANASGTWKVLYDAENLYVIVDVTDDSLQNDSASSWQDDSVEIYFDGGNTKVNTPLSGDDHQYTFGWTTDDIQGTNITGATEGMEHAQVTTDTGWRIEIKMPWLSIWGAAPQAGDLIGIDCYYNDDDDGGDSRENKLLSFSAIEGWNDASQWGTAMLTAEAEPPAALPEGWQSQDIGTTGGSAAESDGTWVISADGADVWGSADEFHYAYVPLSGDGTIVAHVVDNGTGSNNWAKGGVMIRQSLEAGSTHAIMAVTGSEGGGGAFQWRPAADGDSISAHDTAAGIAPGYWVKLERVGNAISGSYSPDGVEWTQQGDAQTIDMTDPVLIGLFVTSHAAGEIRTFTFDNVSVVKPVDVTAPGDAIQGVPNDGLMDGDNFGWPPNETPDLAIDDDTSTKFLHFKGELEPTGFQVTPSAGPSIVTGLTLTTANDEPPRDPVTFELSGSNESIDGPYKLIASGDIVDFAQADAWPRFTMNATSISFDNDVAYAHYQVLFPAVRDPASANSMQIAEVELLGELYVDPDIAAINELYNQATLSCGTGDVELYLSIFTEDTVVMAPGSTAFIGKEVLRLAMEGLFGMFDLGLPYTVDEVGVLGDWAFVRSSFQYSMTPKEGGETTTNPGKQLDILKREADGSWKIYIECWNYDAPLPAPTVAATLWGLGLVKLAQVDDADAMYRGMCDLYTLAVETGDTDLYVANYTDDGVQMPPETPTRIGSEQIRAAIEPALALFDAECPIYPREAVITGDWAFGYCDWSLSLTPKEGGPTTTFNGKGLDVIKRQADGSWKYYIECWNYNGPPIIEE